MSIDPSILSGSGRPTDLTTPRLAVKAEDMLLQVRQSKTRRAASVR